MNYSTDDDERALFSVLFTFIYSQQSFSFPVGNSLQFWWWSKKCNPIMLKKASLFILRCLKIYCKLVFGRDSRRRRTTTNGDEMITGNDFGWMPKNGSVWCISLWFILSIRNVVHIDDKWHQLLAFETNSFCLWCTFCLSHFILCQVIISPN